MHNLSRYILDLGKFDIKKTIGQGEFGEVILIEERETGKKFAAKVNKKLNINSNVGQKTFMNEVETFSKIKYPSVLKFYGYNLNNFNFQPYPTIIIQYMPNGSLQEMIELSMRGMAPREWSDTNKYINLLGISLAMNHLNSKNIIHSDLKPANILLDKNFYPRLCDFGLSKIYDEGTDRFNISFIDGTPFYMAPEIESSNLYSNKVDVYSFAKLAIELIESKINYIKITEIPGEENQKFFECCLSKDPSKRPDFHEICKYIASPSFQSIFSIDFDEVNFFLDHFEDDEGLLVHGIIQLTNEDSPNKEEAAIMFKKSADLGNSDAMFHYAKMIQNGDGVEINKKEAAHYYKLAADKGNSEAMFLYAKIVQIGDGVKVNKKEAANYYKLSADHGNSDAMLCYGIILKNGEEVNANKEEAASYFKISADYGNAEAMFHLGKMLQIGD